VFDLLVLGSGIAGLSAALRAITVHGGSVAVVTKGDLQTATTRWAQGGVAAVLGGTTDSAALHVADTLEVAQGLGDPEAVHVMVGEGPDRVRGLVDLGARFDRTTTGELALTREGGHSAPRIVHAGGAATGAEIERVLADAVRSAGGAVHEHAFVVDLHTDAPAGGTWPGSCTGVTVLQADGSVEFLPARNVLVATGGAGQLYAVTTNPVESTGDGIAMALRAGAACADLEFVQFHPTALAIDRAPRPLLTEALRGEGAVLVDDDGVRFVDELAPRDAVSRAVTRRMFDQGADHVWLDATGIDDFATRYPTLAAVLAAAGLDAAVDRLPVAPAAHYLCGGVLTDLDGATTVPGLWAVGEAACTGVHGANRLASNSLLEGLVFGHRLADAVAAGRRGPSATGAMRAVLDADADGALAPVADNGAPGAARLLVEGLFPGPIGVPEPPARHQRSARPHGEDRQRDDARERLQRAMTSGAGLLRDEGSLASTAAVVAAVAGASVSTLDGAAGSDGEAVAAARRRLETANLAALAGAVVAAARHRTESRGTHARADHPAADPAQRVRLVVVTPRPGGAEAGNESFDGTATAGAG
jgi:L-aspartate oxidase